MITPEIAFARIHGVAPSRQDARELAEFRKLIADVRALERAKVAERLQVICNAGSSASDFAEQVSELAASLRSS